MSREGELPLGVGSRVALGEIRRRGKIALAGKVAQKLRHAERAHDRQSRIEPALFERRDLAQSAARQHRLEATIDRRAQRSALRRQENRAAAFHVEQRLASRRLEEGEALPRRRVDLQRAQDTLRVARLEPRGHHRIARRKLSMERGDRHHFGAGAPFRPYRFRHARHVGNSLCERLEIKPRAADEDRQASFRAHLRQGRRRFLDIAPDGIIDCAIDMTEQKMRCARLFRRARPRGEDAQIAIDLHRIGIDQRAAETLGQAEREMRLAACRRACDEKRGNFVFGHMTFLCLRPRANPKEIALLVFYFSPGSSSLAAHIALHEVGAAFEARPALVATKETRSPEFRAINPEGKVPSLLIDGRLLTEVLAILFYLGRKYPQAKLLPEDIEGEAQALSWMSFLASTVHGARADATVARAAFALAAQRLGAREWALRAYSVVDIFLFRLFWRFAARFNFAPGEFPSLEAHRARMLARAAVIKALAAEAPIAEKVGLTLP